MKLDDATLMAYHDGELDAERSRRVRLLLLSDESVNARLAGLEQLGSFVRVLAAGDAPRRAVVRRHPRRAAMLSRNAGRAAGIAVSFFAFAFVVPGTLPEPPQPEPAPVAAAPPREPEPTAEPAVAVENVDFGAQAGAVFLVQSAFERTTVVWLPDAAEPEATGTL
jgi:hypothetical protein